MHTGASRAPVAARSVPAVARPSMTPEARLPVSQRRRVDPRVVATLAIAIAIAPITLEVVYVVGHFAMDTFEKIPA